jgi:hypothetical protein
MLGLMRRPNHTFHMPDRSAVYHFRDEARRLVALADTCPYAQYKRPLFELAAQYESAARQAEDSLRAVSTDPYAPAYRWRWKRRS